MEACVQHRRNALPFLGKGVGEWVKVGFTQSLFLHLISGQTGLDLHSRSQLCNQGELPPVPS